LFAGPQYQFDMHTSLVSCFETAAILKALHSNAAI